LGSSPHDDWPGGIAAITLFFEDLEAARAFYAEVFGLPVVYEDDNSTVFRFGDTLVNLLRASEAPGLVEPGVVATPTAGVRFQFTLGVDDVDAMGGRPFQTSRASLSSVGLRQPQGSREARTTSAAPPARGSYNSAMILSSLTDDDD
jgi:catechol 2,3-dioxygenase-like lactoylglutathione lyase family enzyme